MRLVFAVAALGVATIAFAQSSEKIQTVPRKQQQASPANQSAQPPINISVQVPEQDPAITKEQSDNAKRNLEIQETIGQATIFIAIATIVQVIAGIAAFFVGLRAANAAKTSADAAQRSVGLARTATAFTISQKRNMDKQLAQMEAGLEVARINANAAKASAEIAKETMHAANRAFLRIDEIYIQDFGVHGAFPALSIKLSNTGNQPASITGWFFTYMVDEPLPQPYQHEPFKRHSAVVYQGGHVVIGNEAEAETGMPKEQWDAIEAGTQTLSVYGVIQYDAGFAIKGELAFGMDYSPNLKNSHKARRLAVSNEPGYNYSK